MCGYINLNFYQVVFLPFKRVHWLFSGGSLSDTLRAVDVPIMTDEKCREAYEDMIDDSMICAGYAEGGKDSCQVKYRMTDKLFFQNLQSFALNMHSFS